METARSVDVTGRQLLVLAGPPLGLAALLVGLVRVRPGVGWPLLLATALLAGTVPAFVGDDGHPLVHVHGAGKYGGVGRDVPPDAEGDGESPGSRGLLVLYSLETVVLCFGYVVAMAVGTRLL